jgi:very-short-patch-repair endonuclease
VLNGNDAGDTPIRNGHLQQALSPIGTSRPPQLCALAVVARGISMKTRLAHAVRCPAALWDTVHGRRLSQKHVDFVVYDRYTAAIIAVVELDDRSHNAKDRRDRDAFVDGVLSSLDVAIVRVRAARTYDVETLRLQLDLKRSP